MCQAKNEIPQQSDEWKTEIFTKMNGKSNKKKNHTKEATEMKKEKKKKHTQFEWRKHIRQILNGSVEF